MIKAIETSYAGCRFRSRLEARWAVFFDTLGVRWLYEHEGFELPSGRYLPDFWLPDFKMFVEVKPDNHGFDPRHDELVDQSGAALAVVSSFPDPRLVSATGFVGGWLFIANNQPYSAPVRSAGYCWSLCPKCMGAGFSFEGGRINEAHLRRDRCTGKLVGNHPRILKAYQAARSARFEFEAA